MSIFSKFKNLFNKNIECGEELNGRIVYLYPLKGRIVHVNSHIIVNDGYNAVFVCNDKVCDVLPSGKFKITGTTLPTCFSRLKLDKANKHGNYAKIFKCDIYFVSTQIINQVSFSSTAPFFAKSEKFGRIKGLTEGITDLQVTEPDKLLKALLVDRPFVGNKEVVVLLTDLIGNSANIMLEHSKFSFTDIIINPKILIPYYNPAINNKTASFGVKIYNLEVASLKLNRKLQKKVSEFLSTRQHFETQFENTGIKFEPIDLVPSKVNLENNSNNMQNENTQNQSISGTPQVFRRGNGINPLQTTNENIQSNNGNNFENELLSNNNKKVCKFCGETIDSNFMFCPKCGFKQ